MLKDSVILIFANKQDKEGAMNEKDIMEKFLLTEIKSHQWRL